MTTAERGAHQKRSRRRPTRYRTTARGVERQRQSRKACFIRRRAQVQRLSACSDNFSPNRSRNIGPRSPRSIASEHRRRPSAIRSRPRSEARSVRPRSSRQRVDIRKYLADKELGSKLTYLETLQQLTENEKDLVVQKSRLEEANAALAAIIETRAQTEAEFQRTTVRRACGGGAQSRRFRRRSREGGAANEASTSNCAGRRRRAAALGAHRGRRRDAGPAIGRRRAGRCRARSRGHDLESGHRLRTSRPGRPDQGRYVQFHALRLASRSRGERVTGRDRPRNSARRGNDRAKGADSESSEPKGQEYVYSARISLDQTQIQVDDMVANLSPGMAVTVEIKTGSRAVISYLLSPLLRYKHDSMRER